MKASGFLFFLKGYEEIMDRNQEKGPDMAQVRIHVKTTAQTIGTDKGI
jgi:hypothetical protein